MKREVLEKIEKLFDLAHQAEISFDNVINLRFSSDGEYCEVVVWTNDLLDTEYCGFRSLKEAEQILLDMFSM